MTSTPADPPADTPANTPVSAAAALAGLWQLGGLPPEALAQVALPGQGAAVLPSSFAVTTAAQSSLAAAALAAAELWHLRQAAGGPRQQVTVDATHATLDSTAWFTLDGVVPSIWDKLSGLYRCGEAVGTPGWVRIHANFAHHRDGALRLLGLPPGPDTERAQVSQALRHWRAEHFESAAAEAGLVVAAARRFSDWDAHPQGQALAGTPVLRIAPIEGAPPAAAIAWPALHPAGRPLAGLRVLELTRILAGPVAGRTLAAHGADVLLVNSPRLPNIEALADTSRGKRSAHVDLATADGGARLTALLGEAHVFLQGYRPGGLAARGFAPRDLARLRPGIVCVSLSAYGSNDGRSDSPWARRRGFDSLVQTATGFNWAEAEAAGSDQPKAMPLQILDYAAGYLLAFGAQAALWRQAREGGSWQVDVSLAGVARWLRGLGRVPGGLQAVAPEVTPYLDAPQASGFGRLQGLRHGAMLSLTPPAYTLPSMPPGSHPAQWLQD
ncbi:CoA transferase [Aquabacterium sp. OR-4]|uniref:CoA transferase n=1 Tax=Aquabacterium sp. OR-4 TaxID=2978127 RepID=UPI0028CA1DAF|nr:CoA transferase [Aquabacterium sp. OR-4]MDT7834369.1 CoA transferase [Aquabacterium sp. OR-4]